METRVVEDIVIVGAGIAGLTTALGLHRLGVRSLVLESSDTLRVTGFALTIWTNAWKALDAVGVGDVLRQQHVQLYGNVTTSLITGKQTSTTSFRDEGKHGTREIRCVRRQPMLEALANELPSGTIRYSSKIVAIEESGFYKIVHLADGTTINTKVLIGCDGIHSVVAKWLGFKEASFAGRYGIRGKAELKSNHGFEPMMMQFFGKGFRAGAMPCDEKVVYWFFTGTSTSQDKELEEHPAKLKQFVLNKLEKMPSDVKSILEQTELDSSHLAPLRYRHPWELMWGNFSKGNVCVAGDAFHPMTPDLGQGGCCALEDGVVLARCLAEAFSKKPGKHIQEKEEEEEQYKRIEEGLRKYAKERRWRSIDLEETREKDSQIKKFEGTATRLTDLEENLKSALAKNDDLNTTITTLTTQLQKITEDRDKHKQSWETEVKNHMMSKEESEKEINKLTSKIAQLTIDNEDLSGEAAFQYENGFELCRSQIKLLLPNCEVLDELGMFKIIKDGALIPNPELEENVQDQTGQNNDETSK